MSAEDLTGELNKLNIEPALPQIKIFDATLPLSLNPFYDGISEKNSAESSVQFCTTTRHQSEPENKRRHSGQRIRRNSESVLDDYKQATPLVADCSVDEYSSRMPGVTKHVLKKSSSGLNRRFVLREPLLRAMQICLCNARRNQSTVLPTDKIYTHGTHIINNNYSNNIPPLSQKNTDYADLVNECHNFLEHDVEFNGRLRELKLNGRAIKRFATLQKASAKFKSKTGVSIKDSKTDFTNLTALTTSCSQQAVNSVTGVCDDVTIDELASYFDTLVHIPKKMSSMAEMMYT